MNITVTIPDSALAATITKTVEKMVRTEVRKALGKSTPGPKAKAAPGNQSKRPAQRKTHGGTALAAASA